MLLSPVLMRARSTTNKTDGGPVTSLCKDRKQWLNPGQKLRRSTSAHDSLSCVGSSRSPLPRYLPAFSMKPDNLRVWTLVLSLAFAASGPGLAASDEVITERDGHQTTLEGQVAEVLKENARLLQRVRVLEEKLRGSSWGADQSLQERLSAQEKLLDAVMEENASLRNQITFMRRQGFLPEEEQITGQQLIEAIAIAKLEAEIQGYREALQRCRDLRSSVTSFFAESPNPNVRRIGAQNWEQFFLSQWQEIDAELTHLPSSDPLKTAFRDSRYPILESGRAAFARNEAEALLAVMKNERAKADLQEAERKLRLADENANRHLERIRQLISERTQEDSDLDPSAIAAARKILAVALEEASAEAVADESDIRR